MERLELCLGSTAASRHMLVVGPAHGETLQTRIASERRTTRVFVHVLFEECLSSIGLGAAGMRAFEERNVVEA